MVYTTKTSFTRMVGNAARSFGWQVTAHETTGGGDSVHVVFFYATAAKTVAHVETMAAIEYFEMCDNLASDPRTARQHIEEALSDADVLILDEESGELMSPAEHAETCEERDEMREHMKQESRTDIFL